MLGLLSGTRGGVLVGESFSLLTFSGVVAKDFCLTGTGGGVLELDRACTHNSSHCELQNTFVL